MFRLLNARYAIVATTFLRLFGRFMSPVALAKRAARVGQKLKVVYKAGEGPWLPAGVRLNASANGRYVSVSYEFVALKEASS